MIDWIIGLLSGAGRGISDLADRVGQAFSGLWNNLTSTFGRWVVYFGLLVSRTADVVGAAKNLASATWHLFIWWAITKLPHELSVFWHTITQFVWVVLNDLRIELMKVINLARAFAQSIVDILRAALMAVINTVISAVNKVITLLNAVAKIVFTLLTDPVALADWIAGSIIQAVMRWARARADWVATLFLGNIVRWTLSAASLIERVIADIL